MLNIKFYSNLENDEISRWVSFPAEVGDKEIQCVITHEALEDNFRAGYRDHLSSAIAHIKTICQLAEKLISESRYEEGRIVIRSSDMANLLKN